MCVYPAYINNKKTLAQGRKIAKEKCVENPTHQEIRDVLLAAGLKVCVENKLYSRERSKELLYRGRIRVSNLNTMSHALEIGKVVFVHLKFGLKHILFRYKSKMMMGHRLMKSSLLVTVFCCTWGK